MPHASCRMPARVPVNCKRKSCQHYIVSVILNWHRAQRAWRGLSLIVIVIAVRVHLRCTYTHARDRPRAGGSSPASLASLSFMDSEG